LPFYNRLSTGGVLPKIIYTFCKKTSENANLKTARTVPGEDILLLLMDFWNL
jgi:hypothetical protein